MKKWLKITLIIVFAPIVLAIPVIIATSFMKEPEKEKVVKIPEDYNLLTLEQKQIEIDLFTSGQKYESQFAALNNRFTEGSKNLVKFPETLELLFNNEEWVKPDSFVLRQNNFYVDNLKEGKLSVIVDVRSENSYSMKVRNKLKFIIKFNLEKDFELIDAKLE